MKYTILGQTGLVVSHLAFGAMTFTAGNQEIGAIYKVGARLAEALVGRALDAGVTFFDTADAYAGGESEVLLGAALKPHREDPFTPLEETLEALDAVVRAGKVRYLGFSNWSAWKVAAALEIQRARGLARFTHGQMHYSLLGRDVERDVIPMMQRYELGLTVWGPLASGFLSGKYTRENLSDPENRYAGFDIIPFDKEHGFRLVERMSGIAVSHGVSMAQVAIAWLLARKSVTSVLIGATKAHQLDDNLGATDLELTAEEIASLDAATPLPPVYPNWFIDRLGDQAVTQALA